MIDHPRKPGDLLGEASGIAEALRILTDAIHQTADPREMVALLSCTEPVLTHIKGLIDVARHNLKL